MNPHDIVRLDLVSVVAFGVAVILLPVLGDRPWDRLERGLRSLARRGGFAIVVTVLCSLAVNVGVSLRHGLPVPHETDEFGHLLAAETFASGRLTNPPHPLWRHFETQGVIQQPTYQSKYPPGDALFLALGRVIGGHEIFGAWIAVALACGALCWMLRAWVGQGWALVGGLWAACFPGIVSGWGQTYLGGGAAMLGGGLVFGALRRLTVQPRRRDAALLGVGLVLFANTRPFEGLLTAILAAAALGLWVIRVPRERLREVVTRAGVPVAVVLVAGSAWTAYYDHRVTGDALVMPYQVWYRTYLGGEGVFKEFVLDRPTAHREPVRTIPGAFASARRSGSERDWNEIVARRRARMILFNAAFYFPGVLALGLAGLPVAIRDRWILFAVVSFGAVLAVVFLGNTTFAPHYSAPVAPLGFAVLIASTRAVRGWTWRSWKLGRWLVRAMGVAFLAFSVHGLFVSDPRVGVSGWGTMRSGVVNELKSIPGEHLVLVRYERGQHAHDQWVQNEADIDGARVVWAHPRGPRATRRLLEYFRDRTVWQLDAARDPPRISRYREGLR